MCTYSKKKILVSLRNLTKICGKFRLGIEISDARALNHWLINPIKIAISLSKKSKIS